MSGTLFFVLLFPVFSTVLAFVFFRKYFNIQMVLAAIFIPIAIGGLSYIGAKSSMTTDSEVWNGKVLSKSKERVSCSHSYSCNCRTVTSGKSSSTTCDTCYWHSYDIDWEVKTSIGTFEINRVDSQGVKEPSRWTRITIGEPWSTVRSFTNYLQGAYYSLFGKSKEQVEAAKKQVPDYPIFKYDYQFVDRIITNGVNIPEVNRWNYDLASILKELGPVKQVNAIIFFTNKDISYVNTIFDAWLGGKKNDVIVVVGVKTYPIIDWVHVISYSPSEIFKVQLRDDLKQLGSIQDRTQFLNILNTNIQKTFVRKRMRDFKYLEDQMDISDNVSNFIIILTLLINVGTIFGTIRYNKKYFSRSFY